MVSNRRARSSYFTTAARLLTSSAWMGYAGIGERGGDHLVHGACEPLLSSALAQFLAFAAHCHVHIVIDSQLYADFDSWAWCSSGLDARVWIGGIYFESLGNRAPGMKVGLDCLPTGVRIANEGFHVLH